MSNPFIIQTLPRSGSHMLRSALNDNPDIICHGEIFNLYTQTKRKNPNLIKTELPLPPPEVFSAQINTRMFGATPEKRQKGWRLLSGGVKDVLSYCDQLYSIAGFVVHAFLDITDVPEVRSHDSFCKRHSQCGPFTNIWSTLCGNVRAITLLRENKLEQYISYLRAKENGDWTVFEGERIPNTYSTSIMVSPKQVLDALAVYEKLEEAMHRRFPDSLVVTYEEMHRDFDAVAQRVQEFLGAEVVPIRPKTLKTGLTLKEQVTNYKELRDTIKRTRFANLLDAQT